MLEHVYSRACLQLNAVNKGILQINVSFPPHLKPSAKLLVLCLVLYEGPLKCRCFLKQVTNQD